MHRHNGVQDRRCCWPLHVGADPVRRAVPRRRAGLIIALLIALGINGFAYFSSDKIALGRCGPGRSARPSSRRCTGSCASSPPPPASRCRGSTSRPPGSQRLRHRAQPAQRGGLLHRGHPRHPRRAGAARGPGPRALPRLQPRHPDLLGGRRPGQRDHVPRLLRLAAPFGAASDDDGPGPLGALAAADPRPGRRRR